MQAICPGGCGRLRAGSYKPVGWVKPTGVPIKVGDALQTVGWVKRSVPINLCDVAGGRSVLLTTAAYGTTHCPSITDVSAKIAEITS